MLPDLADDAATGVRGLPHRLGARWLPIVATTVLCLATVVVVVGSEVDLLVGGAVLVVTAVLATVALTGQGKRPFLAAIGIALVDVVLLVGVPMSETWDLVVVGAGPAGAATALAALAEDPDAAGAAAGPGRLPPRQVVR